MRKTIILAVVFIGLSAVSESYASPDPHDSLLFDGGNVISTNSEKSTFSCRIVVTSAKNAIGDTWEETKGEICGEMGTFVETKDSVVLKDFDKLQENSLITVGPGGYADIVIMAGEGNVTFTRLSLGPNSALRLPSLKEICEALKKKTPGPIQHVKLEKGVTYIEILKDAEKLIKDISIKSADLQKQYNPFFYYAVHTVVQHLMTKFSIEIVRSESDTIDIVKVYEGSVQVSLQKTGELSNADEMARNMEQLAQDMQEGKITAEELQRKVMEYKEQMEKEASQMQPVIIETGYKCIANKSSLKVEPIESNVDRWWENLK